MSNRSIIGKVERDGTVRAVYCHSTGDASALLLERFPNEEQADELISLGNLSAFGVRFIAEDVAWRERENWHPRVLATTECAPVRDVLAYAYADRPGTRIPFRPDALADNGPTVIAGGEDAFFAYAHDDPRGFEFAYLWTPEGWRFAERGTPKGEHRPLA